MRHLIVRVGNHKLPKTIGIFNLPHLTTCPGATAWCKLKCYARKAETMYKQVIPYRQWSFQMSKRNDFVSMVNAELARANKTHIRIHESGDFYNQTYVNKWYEIMKANPQIQFTFYTKSFHLFDFSKIRRLKNVNAFASIDLSTPPQRLKKARGWLKAYILVGNVPGKCFVCPGSCKSCSHCYNKETGNVGFNPH